MASNHSHSPKTTSEQDLDGSAWTWCSCGQRLRNGEAVREYPLSPFVSSAPQGAEGWA